MSENNGLLLFDLLSNISTLNQSRGNCFGVIFFVSLVIFVLFRLSSDFHLSVRDPIKEEWDGFL